MRVLTKATWPTALDVVDPHHQAPTLRWIDPDPIQPNSHASVLNAQDEFETWMLLEFCDRGSLHRAIERRRIQARNVSGQMDLVRGLLSAVSFSFVYHTPGINMLV